MIEIKEVSKIYDLKNRKVVAVDNVSLSINNGDIFGIIGYSGAGKSTLVRMINQLETQDKGKILIDGHELNKLSPKQLRQLRTKIGMIFQHFNLLWSRTVSENIELALQIAGIKDKHKRQQRVKELVDLVGLTGRENAYPSELSGGQKQRVGIARALANDPKILLCDEATSALDPDTTKSILDLLLEINRKLKITIVMITHQMEVVQKICNRVAVMSEGKVVEEGMEMSRQRNFRMSLIRSPQKQENRYACRTCSLKNGVAIIFFISSMVRKSRLLSGTLIFSVISSLYQGFDSISLSRTASFKAVRKVV